MSLNYTPSITSNNATVNTSYNITYTVPTTSLILPKINSFSLTTSPATSTYTFNSKSVLTSAVSPSGNGLNYLTSNATTGNIYYGDITNTLIGQVTPAGIISTYTNTTGTNPIFLTFDNANINLYYSYGGGNSIYYVTGPSATPILFTNTNLNSPRGIAFDSNNDLYVVNTTGAFAISKFDSNGTFIANSTTLSTSGLRGCVFDNSNNLYVADQTNGRIWKCDASLNLQGFTSAGSIPNAASIVFDGSTYLYVSTVSSSKTVFRVDLNGNVTNFYPNNSFTNNASGLTYNRFNNYLYSLDTVAKTIYVDSINQYTFTGVSVPNSATYTLTIKDASSNTITNSLTLNTLSTLNYSSSILTNNATVNTSYNITYTVPTSQLISQNLLPKTNFTLTTTPSTSTYTSSTSVSILVNMDYMNYLTTDNNGNIYYNNNNLNLFGKITPSGLVSVYAYAPDNGARFMAFDNSGIILYYTDTVTNTIYYIPSQNATPILFANNTNLISPRGICFDNSGNLYVTNSGNSSSKYTIIKYDKNGTKLANSISFSNVTANRMYGIAFANRYIWGCGYISGNLFQYDQSLNLINTFNSGFTTPLTIVYDGSSNFYVSDANSVYILDFSGNKTLYYPIGTYSSPRLAYFNNTLYINDSGTSGITKTIYVDSINQYNFTGTSFSTPNTAYTLTIKDASSNTITNSLTLNTMSFPCFKKDTKILCMNDLGETVYIPIQNIRPGTLVKTFRNGFLPVDMIGTSKIYNSGNNERTKSRLYRCSKYYYPELNEDLIITGCHSILETKLTPKQTEKTVSSLGELYVTDEKYRLMAYIDERAKPYEVEGDFSIYHIALKNDDYYTNYGIYANGLLVETCSKRTLTELSDMTLLH